MTLNLKNVKKKVIGGVLVLATAATLSGCTLFNQFLNNEKTPSTTVTTEKQSEFKFDTFLTEQQIRDNCEKLGIDYNDVNINSAEMKKNAYRTSFDWQDENTDGVLMQRAIGRGDNSVKIYYSSALSKTIKSAINTAISEINLIGDKIGDPVYYIYDECANPSDLKPYDVYICYGTTDENAISTFKYDCKNVDGINICCNPVVYLDKNKIFSLSSNELERVILYEVAAHICALQEDSYVSADKKVLSKKVLSSGSSITNESRNITSGDILVRAAKFTKALTVQESNDIIDYAREYESKYFNKYLSDILSYRVTEDLQKMATLLGTISPADFLGVAKTASDFLSQINLQKNSIIEEIKNKYDSNISEDDVMYDFDVNNETYLRSLHDDADSYFKIENNKLSCKTFYKKGDDYTSVNNIEYIYSLKNLGENGFLKIGNALQKLKVVGDNVYLLALNKDQKVIINKIGEVITKEEYENEISENYEKMYQYIAKKQTEISQDY